MIYMVYTPNIHFLYTMVNENERGLRAQEEIPITFEQAQTILGHF